MDTSDVVALLGLLAIAAGLVMVALPLALIVVGLFLVLSVFADQQRRKAAAGR